MAIDHHTCNLFTPAGGARKLRSRPNTFKFGIFYRAVNCMECTEIVVQKTYSEEEVYTEVYTTLIERKDAATVLEMFCKDVPLQNYGLNHLKRIQPLDRSARDGPLQIVVCPVHSFDEVPQHVRDVCSEKQVVKVCSIAPTTRPEFEAWNKCWPINFHASHLEKEREKGLTREDLQQVEQVDSGLYSRQLLVLGITGQIAVRGAHVLVVGNSTLGSEVVKNLALAGVGKLTILGSNIVDARGTICGTDGTLHCFAKAVNSGIEVCCSGVLTVQVYSHYLVLVMLSSSR
jgi:hypothetical protein